MRIPVAAESEPVVGGRWLRACAAMAVIACAAAAAAADGAAARGGLVPVPHKTREELIREWDLDHNGSIDPGEAEVAASRMRRERAEMRLNSGIDPVTGRPRGEPLVEQLPDDVDKTVAPEEAEEGPATDDRDERPALPGTRLPRPTVPGVNRAAEPPPPASRPAAGGRAAADPGRRPTTGGVRAGGLPARAGYGAGVPAAPLNAGLPIVPRTRTAAEPANRPRGGLVPVPRAAPTAPQRDSREPYNPY